MFSLIRWHAVSQLTVLLITTCLISLAATAFAATTSAATTAEAKRSSRDGTVVVSWEPDYAQFDTLLIQSARGESVAQYPVIKGQNWVITGMEDGQYQFILTSSTSDKTLFTLTVEHYALSSAFGLFIAGLAMFVYLIFALVKGERRD